MEKYKDQSLTPKERAEDLTDRMTVEEQASQLKYDAPAVERLGLPAYNWWNEGLHGAARAGTATVFPQAVALAAMFDCDMLYRAACIIAEETRAKHNAAKAHGDRDIYKGLTLWSPNVNIFRDPRWGRGHETYGEDPYLTSRLGEAFVKGLQGEGGILKTAACAKHFAAHSGPEALRHEFNANVASKDMEETYLPAFKALVRSGVQGVMGAYNRVNGEAACASPYLMGKLKEWGFEGYFVSDCWAIRDLHTNHGLTETMTQSAAMALKAGCTINCGEAYMHLAAALDEGLIDKTDIRSACVKAMETRIKLGQLDRECVYDDIPYSVISCKENKAFSLKCAEKSMVLLKNDGILPLDKSKVRTIAVIGPNADSRAALEGNYCGTADRYVTFLEGIEDAFGGRVLYSRGCHLYKDRTSGLARPGDRYSEALAAAENADVIIACVGLDASIEGEEGDTGNEFSSGDKNDLRLPLSQRILLDILKKTGKPMIVVLAAGSSVNIECGCNALINVWYSGQCGGTALANILFGSVSPSGKLPVTFYETADKLPDFEDYSMENRTYRYTRGNILYPFGFGLTYSRVECTSLEYRDGKAYVTAENKGGFDTDDVIQLYIKPSDENAPPYPRLCGFKRIHIRAGERTGVVLDIPAEAFETVDRSGVRAVRGRRFTLYAGVCQSDELSERLTGTKCVRAELEL
ncbi:MAG: glycoside hydrolase family 3 C-terminal domain-containing protein [Ruminococcus sp.]|nr:glycoside hydrolase family 3 C-terminal domain-containing protein [Ruminococcus sp.]